MNAISGKNLNPKPQLTASNQHNNMNTTHTMNATVALGLAPKSNPTAATPATRPVSTADARRKTLALGLLAVATSTAAVVVFQAAMSMGELHALLDQAYKISSLSSH